jgi:hypothetical protein
LEIKRLRDLPGVSEIEALCQVPSYFDERNIRETMERIDAVSIGLFSLSYFDTDYDCFDWDDDEDPPSEERWDGLLSNALKPYGETEAFWRALGWDITDGRGRELDCAHYFARQTIIAESGWIEGVQLTPDGSGSEPVSEGSELTEEELAERLEQEVRDFLLRRS